MLFHILCRLVESIRSSPTLFFLFYSTRMVERIRFPSTLLGW